MKIVHIITRLIIGGAQENTLLSCQGQHRLGHEVTLITGPGVGPEGSLMDRARSSGYRVIEVPQMHRALHAGNDFSTYCRLVRLLRQLQPDVVHTHSSKAGILGRWAARQAGVPVIIHTIHGLAFTASTSRLANSVYRTLERWTAPITTKIVCVAGAMSAQSLEADIGETRQYVTVYSGMETQAFLAAQSQRERIRQRLGLQPEHIAVGTIARLFDLKGHDDLIDIAPDLCKRFTHLRFLWIGDGSLRQHLEKRIAAAGLEDRFILTGLVKPDEIPDYCSAMDILAHPSRREGLARALPQGQLAGCPVVVYGVDGNAEGLLDGVSGFVIAPFDREQLAQRLATLLNDAPMRQRMGQAGRQFALGRFSAETMVQQLQSVYLQAMDARR